MRNRIQNEPEVATWALAEAKLEGVHRVRNMNTQQREISSLPASQDIKARDTSTSVPSRHLHVAPICPNDNVRVSHS